MWERAGTTDLTPHGEQLLPGKRLAWAVAGPCSTGLKAAYPGESAVGLGGKPLSQGKDHFLQGSVPSLADSIQILVTSSEGGFSGLAELKASKERPSPSRLRALAQANASEVNFSTALYW